MAFSVYVHAMRDLSIETNLLVNLTIGQATKFFVAGSIKRVPQACFIHVRWQKPKLGFIKINMEGFVLKNPGYRYRKLQIPKQNCGPSKMDLTLLSLKLSKR